MSILSAAGTRLAGILSRSLSDRDGGGAVYGPSTIGESPPPRLGSRLAPDPPDAAELWYV